MRGWTFICLVILVGALSGCGSSVSEDRSSDSGPQTAAAVDAASTTEPAEKTSTSETTAKAPATGPEGSTVKGNTSEEDTSEEKFALRTEEIPLQRPITTVGFGLGSLWLVDLGNYECDDTGGGAAACAAPRTIFLRALSPESYEFSTRVPFKGSMDASVAFGAGSVWVSAIPQNPSSGGLFRVEPETGEVLSRLPVESSTAVAFGEGSVWVTSEERGALLRVDPDTGETTAEIKASSGGANDLAVGGGAVWVASWGPVSGPVGQDHFKGKKLVRVDPETGEVAAEVPIEQNVLEGGVSSVAVDDETGAVWATSVNGKLFRVDPETNRIVAEVNLGDYAWKVETFAGDAWVIYETGINDPSGATQCVVRIDSETNRPVGSMKVKNARDLAAGRDALWLTTSDVESGAGSLTRIVP